jgi:hypothetical protein
MRMAITAILSRNMYIFSVKRRKVVLSINKIVLDLFTFDYNLVLSAQWDITNKDCYNIDRNETTSIPVNVTSRPS